MYRNASGVLVDANGVLLGLARAKAAEAEDLSRIVGHDVKTPAEFMKAVALDPRLPLEVRMDAANKAAPYTDRKQPTGVDGGVDANGRAKPLALQLSLDEELVKRMPVDQLQALNSALKLLREAGVLAAPA